MKNPYVFWGLAILAFVGGVFIGKSEWFKNLFITTTQSTPRPTSEGQSCTTTAGKPGRIKNGICTDTGGMPLDDTSIQRTDIETNSEQNTNGNADTTRQQGSQSNAPNDLFLPLNLSCQKYTIFNPYVYLGCKYVYAGIVLQNGIRVCRLKRTTC